MRQNISNLSKSLLFIVGCEAPRPQETVDEEPALLPALVPPNTQVYKSFDLAGSHSVCVSAVGDFRNSNYQLCRRLRELIGDDHEHIVYERWASGIVMSWGARLCTDPELPKNGEYDDCDAAFFCRVLGNLNPCPQSLLQEHINHIRFRMKCEGMKVSLDGRQPDTTAGCYTEKELIAHREAEHVKQETELMKRFPDSKVFDVDGKVVYAKPVPYICSE